MKVTRVTSSRDHDQLVEVAQWYGAKHLTRTNSWFYGQYEIADIYDWLDLQFCFENLPPKLASDPTQALMSITTHFINGEVMFEASIRSTQYGTAYINSYPARDVYSAVVGVTAQWIKEKRVRDKQHESRTEWKDKIRPDGTLDVVLHRDLESDAD